MATIYDDLDFGSMLEELIKANDFNLVMDVVVPQPKRFFVVYRVLDYEDPIDLARVDRMPRPDMLTSDWKERAHKVFGRGGAVLSYNQYGEFGWSICSMHDTFNLKEGKRIAISREGRTIPTEVFNLIKELRKWG